MPYSTLPVHPTLRHPITGEPLRADYITRRGAVIWPILGASEPPDQPDSAAGDAGQNDNAPEGDQGREPTPPAETPQTFTQAELEKAIAERLRRERAKYVDYKDVKAKADQYDSLLETTKTEQERAVEAAEKRGREAAEQDYRAKAATRLVAAEFRAAAKGVLPDDTVAGLVEDLDLGKYLDDAGEPDLERITARVTSLAPKAPEPPPGRADLGQGRRPTQTAAGTAAGVALYEQRHKRNQN